MNYQCKKNGAGKICSLKKRYFQTNFNKFRIKTKITLLICNTYQCVL